ncbi:hypothetical protein ABIC50_004443 [Burkholderia sp. 567]
MRRRRRPLQLPRQPWPARLLPRAVRPRLHRPHRPHRRHRRPYRLASFRMCVSSHLTTQAVRMRTKLRRHTTITHRSCWMRSCRPSRPCARLLLMRLMLLIPAPRRSVTPRDMPCRIPPSRPTRRRVMRTASIRTVSVSMSLPRRHSMRRSTLLRGKTSSAHRFPDSANHSRVRLLRRCLPRVSRWRHTRLPKRLRPPSHRRQAIRVTASRQRTRPRPPGSSASSSRNPRLLPIPAYRSRRNNTHTQPWTT